MLVYKFIWFQRLILFNINLDTPLIRVSGIEYKGWLG